MTKPQLIEAYVRIRTTRDDTFIQVYAQMDEQYKEVQSFAFVLLMQCCIRRCRNGERRSDDCKIS